MEHENSNNQEPTQLGIGTVSSRLSSADPEELQKCKDSPVYFYNKYVRKDGQKELTEAEYNDFVKQVEYQRNMPLKLQKHYKERPLLPSECYKKMNKEIQNNELSADKALHITDVMYRFYQQIAKEHKVHTDRIMLAMTDDGKYFQAYVTNETETELRYLHDYAIPNGA